MKTIVFAATPTKSLIALQTLKRMLGDNIPERSLFEICRPETSWFLRPDYIHDIHGMNHEARVMVWAEILGRLEKSKHTDALRWAAATHDLRRKDNGTDAKHGKRAAKWVYENDEKFNFDPLTKKYVLYLDCWHATKDKDIPKMLPELAIFKDADALDRVRFYGLDTSYLRYEVSRTVLCYLAEQLYKISEDLYWDEGMPIWECVMEAGIRMGIINNNSIL
jgi:hypothetical protein